MNIVCPVCTQHSQTEVYRCAAFELLRCNECRLVMKSFGKSLARGEVQQLQDVFYVDLRRTELRVNRVVALDRLKMLTRFRQNGKLLEIGCATGEFLQEATVAGFQGIGIDASERYAAFAQQSGLEVIHGRLEDIPAEIHFDIVVMFHVFEHIETPNEFLQDVKKILAPGGLLMQVVPNVISTTNQLFGFNHPIYHQSDHLFFYDHSTLSQTLENNGFEIEAIQSQEYAHHLFTSLQGVLGLRLKSSKSPNVKRGLDMPAEGHEMRADRIQNGNETLKRLLRESPYLLGKLFYPILRLYGKNRESRLKGHELMILSKKKS